MVSAGSFGRQLGAALIQKSGLSLVVGISLIILIGLGTWQLTRLQWKQHLIHELERTQSLTPISVEAALSAETSQAWRPVNHVHCRIDKSRIIYMHGLVEAKAGYHLITVCPLGENAPAMVVDLGFSEQKPLNIAGQDVTLTGRLRPFEAPNSFTPPNSLSTDDWYWRIPSDIANRFATAVRDDYFLSTDLKASGISFDGLTQGPITAELPNRHLEYALTWYGLAVVMLSFFAVMIYRGMRPDSAQSTMD